MYNFEMLSILPDMKNANLTPTRSGTVARHNRVFFATNQGRPKCIAKIKLLYLQWELKSQPLV